MRRSPLDYAAPSERPPSMSIGGKVLITAGVLLLMPVAIGYVWFLNSLDFDIDAPYP